MTKSQRDTFHHGNLKAAALDAAYDLVAGTGHETLSLRQVAGAVGVAHRSIYNHFEDREALLDAVAMEGFTRLAALLRKATTAADYTRQYVRFALANPSIYSLMSSRRHGTMKHNPPLQAATHGVITEAMRVFCRPDQTSAERRRTVMKVYMILYGGISLYAAGILDLPNEQALVAELMAMTTSA
ncbi:TetR/AcrR family transcriptional regulator [Reyranella sp. CPCC 100927]|uniref:TetR/AcrR family transcriptional regulator n=1 Tax=Reyranella sp. CPCC 100927 TaxID=2599616 RepID=UPI0011B81FEF|nr:TetR/AcrR family transcriptional regulator [Reyranella sp. CPCC 100927]TWT11761.1 TetR/AcrR family transcriptional regulator [Reyranella sp. CPCC 100927]